MIEAGYIDSVHADLDPRRRRGPLRPEQLLSARKRQGRRLSAHTFRTLDLVVLVIATAVSIRQVFHRSLLDTTVGGDLQFVVGMLVFARLVRSVGLYRFGRTERWVAHALRLALCAAGAWVVALLTRTVVGSNQTRTQATLTFMLICLGVLLVLHTTWWWLVRQWRREGWLTPNLVIVGATALAEDLIGELMTSSDMHVLGIFDDRASRIPDHILDVPVLGDTNSLLTHKITPFVDLIVVAVDPRASSRVTSITSRLSVLPNQVTLMFDPHNDAERAAAIAHLSDAPLSPINATTDADRKAYAKRLQDLVIGIPMLIIFSPLIAIVAAAVRIDSPGPVFFRQRRHGFNNEEINVWKFRSMRHDRADATSSQQVRKNDDRVTRVGRILRSTSLDELLQLFNVIRGEMSLVGPRPHAIGMKTGDVESARLVAEYAHRHRIKPGMTGWAAIKGSRGPLHAAADVSRRVALDVDYIERQNFWLDLRIMLMTVPGMLGDHGSIR